jgi:protein involved in polysaccharide export with SLBB domain
MVLFVTAYSMQIGVSAAAQSENAPAQPSTGVVLPKGDSVNATTLRYKLQPGDSFELVFPYVSGFNQTVTVQRDGFISLRIIGDLQAAGLTVPELAETIRERYAVTMRDPVLTLELKDYEKPYFVAAGEVEKPGKYDLRSDTTLMQAVAIAGGFKDRAKKTHVAVFRRGADGPKFVQVQEIDAKRMMEGREFGNDVRLEPADLVFVSKTKLPSMNTFMNSVLPNLGWIVVAIVNHP